MRKFLSIIGVFGLMLFVAASAQAAVEYSVAYMGNFTPLAINSLGEVVGVTSDANTGYSTALLYNNGKLTDLGSLGGTYNSANGINDSGQIVGQSESADGALHSFLYENGEMKDLGTFGGISSTVYGINNSGQIVGCYDTADGGMHAILYDHGAITDLGNLGGNMTGASVINSTGVIAGVGTTNQGDRHAFVYEKGNIIDLGISGTSVYTTGINDTGQVVGDWWTQDAGGHVFLYENGNVVDIDSLPEGTFADDINNNGEIVGYGRGNIAFIYSNGTMSTLSDLIDQPGITLTYASKINDVGQIAAIGSSDQYGYGAYLLTPVPEPASAILSASGIACVLFRCGRNSRFVQEANN